MKHLLLLFFVSVFGWGGVEKSFAQNLVPNGDFEQYIGCPTLQNQVDSALFWHNPSTTIPQYQGSPDYMNVCSPNYAIKVPHNQGGYQVAHSGNAYCAIILFDDFGVSHYREYIETSLITPLEQNVCYHLTFYISLTNSSDYNSDDIAAYFSDTLISGNYNYTPLPFSPQFNNPTGNFPDSLNWTKVEGDYTAYGGESFLTIGNFKLDQMTTHIVLWSNGEQICYVYIDDVSLWQCQGESIDDLNEDDVVNIYPKIFSNELNIEGGGKMKLEFYLYDMTSKKILEREFTNSTTLNTEQLASGIYFYEVRSNNEIIKKGKIIKQ